ncbi:MAG TPA: SHOCT domain-containing protein [Streptosporangiaceae bacterium]|jgi:hypothetical protein
MARTAVVAGTASAVAGGMASNREARAHQQEAQIDRQVAASLAEQQTAQTPQATPAGGSPAGGLSDESIVRLQQLGELVQQGILTDEEFAQQKARILST